ncbi:FKBP-type peptidyl-prolyl cis-trans isomerase [Winogradskyella sp. R77965]|uniref:FKBP-type peptidyl-prolyl cis-trans isomerase n=1 Tax=Winogradskyella sp. R77965 TaxID=3093872 RepID=UPI0037DC2DF7
MKISTFKLYLCVLAALTVFISCEEDDPIINDFVEEDRTEQQEKDNDSILDYLSSHYYNSSFFETGTDHKYTDIIISELPEGEDVPDGSTLLIDAVETHTTEFLEADYEYYILRINQGGGEAPKFTDLVRVRYEGSSVEDGDVFDSRITPLDLALVGNGINTFGTIRAWQLVMPSFNASTGFSLDNGVVNYNNFGLGVMFVPSGLAYFSGITTGSSYDNLIFKFEMLQYETVDDDGDGIPSYVEDLDANLSVFDDDSDEDEAPNFIDLDDDGDEVSTFNELEQTIYIVDTNMGESEPILDANEYEFSRITNAGIITITTVKALDTNSNGILDYLDEDITINYNETSS